MAGLGHYKHWTPEDRRRGLAIVKKAIKDGILKPEGYYPCMWCNQKDGIQHLHQVDYDNPLYPGPIPLCQPCHMVFHMGEKNPVLREEWRLAISRGWKPPPMRDHKEWFRSGTTDRTIKAMRAFLATAPFPDGQTRLVPA